jgi:hypothetical protein
MRTCLPSLSNATEVMVPETGHKPAVVMFRTWPTMVADAS